MEFENRMGVRLFFGFLFWFFLFPIDYLNGLVRVEVAAAEQRVAHGRQRAPQHPLAVAPALDLPALVREPLLLVLRLLPLPFLVLCFAFLVRGVVFFGGGGFCDVFLRGLLAFLLSDEHDFFDPNSHLIERDSWIRICFCFCVFRIFFLKK